MLNLIQFSMGIYLAVISLVNWFGFFLVKMGVGEILYPL